MAEQGRNLESKDGQLAGHGSLHKATAAGHPTSRWYLRVPMKLAIFLIVTFFVLFPNPAQFARHVSHLRNMNAMIEPDAPELADWAEEIRVIAEQDRRDQDGTPRLLPWHVQRFVYEHVDYDWDWNVWGSADYMPTVREMFAKAAESADGRIREDCDGRAVIAASLMQRLDCDASLATDLRHVWVVTRAGEWMGPGGAKTVVSTPEGNRTAIASILGNVPVSLSFGLAVFPLWRELILLATAFGLMLHRGMSWRTIAFGGLLMLQGLLFMRLGYSSPARISTTVSSWPAWVGAAHLAGGIGFVIRHSRRARRSRARADG